MKMKCATCMWGSQLVAGLQDCDVPVSKEHCWGWCSKTFPSKAPSLCNPEAVIKYTPAPNAACATGFDTMLALFFEKKLLRNSAQIRIQFLGFYMNKYTVL